MIEWAKRSIPEDEECWYQANLNGLNLALYRDTLGVVRCGTSVGFLLPVNRADMEAAQQEAEALLRQWWRELGVALGELESEVK